MIPRIVLAPAVLLAALAFATPEASAHDRVRGRHHGQRINHRGAAIIGARVAIPVGRTGGYWREVVSYTGGHYETRTRRVEVPGRQIGFDFEGNPLYAGSRFVTETYRVYIPRKRIVQRVWVPSRPAAVVTVGGRARIR